MPEVPLVAHVIHHLVIGGLENGLVNLINRMPASRYRHAIVCMTRYSDFRNRIQNPTVEVFALNRRDGSDWPARVELFRLIRRLKPAIVHSRGMSGLDSMLPAMLNGVSARIHGEHGRDMNDLDGTNLKAQWVRRLHRPFISHYIALSKDLKSYLEKKIRVPERRITQIYNGVDCQYFRPALSGRAPLPESGFANDTSFIIGTVGRMQAVKDQVNLTKAFILLATLLPEKKHQLRLVIVGDGPLWAQCGKLLDVAGLRHLAWLPGARDDVADLMRGMDLFILPSLAEGISNTILEAMACGLPVIATQVGGNPELVEEGITGSLIPAADPGALAEAMIPYLLIPGLCANRGRAGRIRTESQFSIESMVDSYMRVYDRVLERKTVQTVMQS
ncbi:MAG: TIGR03088 family PEP-CTERM/XrtA system glycosyltransferase [Pseudomonadota bacterium]|nr:TIGR03088 family PEP-CTERM/XrtA system glycosyltransferase [Pseudomonadota bacterium]